MQTELMGRTRSFDENVVVAAATEAFLAGGYEGTSVDDLVGATGLHRGSLYQAFGSKLGLFLAGLRRVPPLDAHSPVGDLDLLVVAALELAPRQDEVRRLVAAAVQNHPDPARLLGDRLLARARVTTAQMEDPS